MTGLVRCPGVAGEGCEAQLAPGRDRCNFCRRDRERLNPDPTPPTEGELTMTDDLIRQLREGGYDGAADQVRDAEIAKQLRDAGRDDLAETLEGKTEPAAPKNPVEAEAEQFLKTLKEKNESAWTSAGGLLD